MTHEAFDYVVVGGGTSGCVLASRLSENPDVRVLLLEAGLPDSSVLLSIPGLIFRVAFDPKFGWGYMTEPQKEMNDRALPLIQAKVLGGGSSINGMVYTRGAAADFDAWRDLGCEGWSYEDVLPYFLKSEASHRGPGPYHGGDGPVSVVGGRCDLPIIDRIREALVQRGYPIADDLNVPAPDGFGYYDWTIGRGRRASISKTYAGLRDRRPNLIVRTRTPVHRIIVQSGRASGAQIVDANGRERTIVAEREVVLCCGAINSAKLLMLAGIGPADSLSALGIDVAVDLAQVGQNLQNHTTYRIEYGCTKLITGYIYMKPAAGLRELGRYVFARSGYLSGGASPFGGFYRSVDTLPAPDLQMFVSPLLFGRRSGPLGLLPTAHGFSFGINQGIPHSRGAVTLRSADPAVPPSIDPRYFSDPRDLDVLVNGTLRLREIAAQPALARVIDRELAPGPNVATPESILRDVRANAGNHYHVAGTCRMGTDDDAVTDLQLRVRGVAGLRVADLSVAPRLVNGNTNAVATMIAERAAEFMTTAG